MPKSRSRSKNFLNRHRIKPTVRGGVGEDEDEVEVPFYAVVNSNDIKLINYCGVELNFGNANYKSFKKSDIHGNKLNDEELVSDLISKYSLDEVPIIGPIFNVLDRNQEYNLLRTLVTIFKNYYIIKRGGALHKECLKKYGGGLTFFEELQEYCSIVIDDEKDMENFITNTDYTSHINDIKFDRLKQYIDTNKTPKKKLLYINLNPFYDYATCQSSYDPTKVLKISYDCFEYNEDIVSSYESLILKDVPYDNDNKITNNTIEEDHSNGIYSNNPAINIFIEEQNRYLETLTLAQKRIIQDYTKINTSFHFYELYKNNKPEFKTFRYFSDSFYIQIYFLYNDEHAFELNEAYYSKNKIHFNDKNWFEDWLNRDRVPDVEEEYGKAPEVYAHATETVFSHLNFIEWNLVLDKFIDDITKIILKAPEVKEPIHGYRGVSGHYIHESQSEVEKNRQLKEIKRIIQEKARNLSTHGIISDISDTSALAKLQKILFTDDFLNLRLSSITFDFTISKFFHDKFKNENSAIYKTTIQPGCKVLLIARLSMFYKEFEILTPPYTTTSYIDESKFTKNELANIATSNNINKKYGICIRTEFSTYFNIIVKTPISYENYQDMPKIIEERRISQQHHTEICASVGLSKAVGKFLKKDDCQITTGQIQELLTKDAQCMPIKEINKQVQKEEAINKLRNQPIVGKVNENIIITEDDLIKLNQEYREFQRLRKSHMRANQPPLPGPRRQQKQTLALASTQTPALASTQSFEPPLPGPRRQQKQTPPLVSTINIEPPLPGPRR
jgi:hypothetical protein